MKKDDETESEEEGEEVNQLVDEDDKRGTKMSQWKRLRKRRRMSSPCTKSTTMLSSPWTLWRPSTHMMTHEGPWIFEDVELVLKNMQLAKFFSHRMESYKELTCEFLAR
ncbi:unnamed protein product [Microthlaspi erraticum]|uniref:Arabidopsis retrotransposon Orf1 C-terminal domain-containing protein n=1 Tax=Microthlaspi erraticum TaxID=1685480 RepID=A0A6D2JZJ3_9BRAS|nr:unnamed protein product [Microthlaspi erraticum]